MVIEMERPRNIEMVMDGATEGYIDGDGNGATEGYKDEFMKMEIEGYDIKW
jgi:hypothetical protein